MEPIVLGPSGRPQYTEHEVEIVACSDVQVIGPQNFNGNYLVRLTNFRFIFQDTRSQVASSSSTTLDHLSISPHRMLHWSFISNYAVSKSFLFWRSNTVTLSLFAPSQQADSALSVALTLAADQYDKFLGDIKLQFERKSWLHYPMEYLIMTGKADAETVANARPKQREPVARPSGSAMAGISGLTKHLEEKNKAVETSLHEAFKDMDSLFDKAKEMVTIANRLSASAKNAAAPDEAQSHFQSDIMRMMGIRSPVTLGSHDNYDLYCEELARELDTFVCTNFDVLKRKRRVGAASETSSSTPTPSYLQTTSFTTPARAASSSLRIGSEVIPLTDLYCLFNRARGSALVSPEDLLQACKRLAPLRLSNRLLELNDGVLAVASENYDEASIARQVFQLLQEAGPMSAAQLSAHQGIGLPLSMHYLLRAEAMELLCRDHSSEGLIFWPNCFKAQSA